MTRVHRGVGGKAPSSARHIGLVALTIAGCSPWEDVGADPRAGTPRLTAADCLELPEEHDFEPVLLTGQVASDALPGTTEGIPIHNACDVPVEVAAPRLLPVHGTRAVPDCGEEG